MALLDGIYRAIRSRLAPPAEAKAMAPVFSPYGGTGYGSTSGWIGAPIAWPFPPGAKYDYAAEAGDTWRNSAVAAILGWIGDNFAEPGLRVVRRVESKDKDGTVKAEWVPEPDHPLLKLLEHPNPFYGWHTLAKALVLSYRTDGNAYWMIAKGGAGNPLQLWWIPHFKIWPRWNQSGSQYLGWFDYMPGGTTYKIDPSDIVHFRDGVDPYFDRLGCAPLKHAAREVCADNEGAGFTAAILRNSGVVSYLLQPVSPDVEIDEDEKGEIKREFQENSTRENRGKVMVASGQVKLDRLGSTPEEMALDKILRMPEARICAMLRVPAQVMGFISGESSRTFSNYEQARKSAYLDGIVPFQKEVAWTINHRLMPMFERDPHTCRFEFDYSRVEALAESEDAKFERWGKAFAVYGGCKLNEYRMAINLPPEDGPEGDEYSAGGTPEDEVEIDPETGEAVEGRGEGAEEDGGVEGEVKAANPARAARRRAKRRTARGGAHAHASGRHGYNPNRDADGKFKSGPHADRAKPPSRMKSGAVEAHPSPAAARAKSTGKIVGKEEHVYAEHAEKHLAKSVGGEHMPDNEAVDVQIPRHGGGHHGLESKTLIRGKKQAVTMHPDAVLRKVNYAESHPNNVVHTVVMDHRDRYRGGEAKEHYSGHELYYKRGAGRYSLGSMHKVADHAELRTLIDTPDHLLPAKARGSLPKGAALDKLRGDAEKAHASRLKKDTARKRRIREESRAGSAA